MDPRRSPAFPMVAGVQRHHTAEVRNLQTTHQIQFIYWLHLHQWFVCDADITLLIVSPARCPIFAERSRVVIGGVKRWPFDVTDAMVPHGENVTFYCKHPRKQCSFVATKTCFDGELQPPACYLGKPATTFVYLHGRRGETDWLFIFGRFCLSEPTWLQYKLFPHRLVSEIEACEPGDEEWWPTHLTSNQPVGYSWHCVTIWAPSPSSKPSTIFGSLSATLLILSILWF